MTQITIDYLTAVRLVREEVEAAGADFVYQSPIPNSDPALQGRCVYQYGGYPSCLVGRALFRAGVPIETLKGWDGEFGSPGITNAKLPEWLAITAKALDFLSDVQEQQDNRRTWGQAFDYAILGDTSDLWEGYNPEEDA